MPIDELARVEPDLHSGGSSLSWRTQLQSVIAGISQDSPLERLGGELRVFDFSGARLYQLHSDVQDITRKRPCPHGRFAPMAMVPLDGPVSLSQFGRTRRFERGEFGFIDAAAPLKLTYSGEFRHLFLQFPASSFAPAFFHKSVAQAVHTASEFDALFQNLVEGIWRNADQLRPLEHSSALNSLLSLCLLTSPFRDRTDEFNPCIRVSRAMAYIEHNLSEEWLTPQAVADAQDVSRRYLDDLFGKHGLRIERWIWERRLLRAKEELEMSGRIGPNRGKSIIQIALDVGFKSPSHFSRSFSERFGMSPRELRKLSGYDSGSSQLTH